MNQIKPRYRLGTQNMLDKAKDDARLIPENTLFKVRIDDEDRPVWRGEPWSPENNDPASVRMDWGRNRSDDYWFFSADQLKPFI